MKSSQNALWVAGAGVLAALLVVATYFLVVAPKRSEAADLATQRVSVQQSNTAIAQRTAQLESQFQSLDEKRDELAAIKATLPSESDVPDLLRQVESYAGTAGLQVSQVQPGTPAAFTTSSPESAATAGSTTTEPTTTASGIVAIPLTIGVSGSFPQIELYTKNLQADMTRHFLVTGLTVTPDTSASASDGVTGTITGSIFVLTDGATAGADTSSATASTTTETATVS